MGELVRDQSEVRIPVANSFLKWLFKAPTSMRAHQVLGR